MAQWKNIEFYVPRITDRQVLDAAMAAFADADIKIQRATLTPLFVGPAFSITGSDYSADEELKELLDAESILLASAVFSFAGKLALVVERTPEEVRDKVVIQCDLLRTEPGLATRDQIIKLLRYAKEHFRELKSLDYLGLLGDDARRHFEAREASVAHLEGVIQRIQTQFIEQVAQQRASLEAEYQKLKRSLERECAERDDASREAEAARAAVLDERERQLDERVAKVDDQDAKHARRRIREELQQELGKRAERFELTEGTQRLRRPVQLFLFALLGISGTALVAYSIETLSIISSDTANPPDLLTTALRQGLSALAFGSTVVFYLRWNNRWFERHATEEFQLKRLQLDLDRASWVVEMALEWKEEKGADIPSELIQRLTANLFAADQAEDSDLHPADQLASALLGASAEANIEIPGGSSLRLDRRGIKGLKGG